MSHVLFTSTMTRSCVVNNRLLQTLSHFSVNWRRRRLGQWRKSPTVIQITISPWRIYECDTKCKPLYFIFKIIFLPNMQNNIIIINTTIVYKKSLPNLLYSFLDEFAYKYIGYHGNLHIMYCTYLSEYLN